MTVAELIAELEKHQPYLEVYSMWQTTRFVSLSNVSAVRLEHVNSDRPPEDAVMLS